MSALDSIADVDIDSEGRFKYILIEVSHAGKKKCVVRGYKWAGYHADIYEDFDKKYRKNGIETDCIGGGRILHEPNKSIEVYGYSQGFGQADHSVTTELLKKKYPTYASITWSNSGY